MSAKKKLKQLKAEDFLLYQCQVTGDQMWFAVVNDYLTDYQGQTYCAEQWLEVDQEQEQEQEQAIDYSARKQEIYAKLNELRPLLNERKKLSSELKEIKAVTSTANKLKYALEQKEKTELRIIELKKENPTTKRAIKSNKNKLAFAKQTLDNLIKKIKSLS